MSPRKPSTPRVTKPATGKSPAKPKERKDSDLKKQLLFLWTCHKLSGAHVNIPAVAEHYGIKNNAAQMRYTRLKKKLEELEAENSVEKSTEAKVKEEDEDDGTVHIEDIAKLEDADHAHEDHPQTKPLGAGSDVEDPTYDADAEVEPEQ